MLATKLARRSVEVQLLVPVIESGQPVDGRGLATPRFLGFEKDVFTKPPWWRRRLF